ncbi:MAG: hypothetical protein RLY16_1992 [Bacteroidota bacterium]|jgi:8-amino-7-oxononanoate synthase
MKTNAINRFNGMIRDLLAQKESNGLKRSLVSMEHQIDFSSNDYLGLAKNSSFPLPESIATGATGSRSITGNPAIAEETEAIIAAFHQREAALIFNTGYMANVGLLSCIAQRGDTYISDEYIHASMIDGMRLSHAHRLRFKHNDLADLAQKLKQATGQKFVLTESVFSMDGDMAPLAAIADLCEAHDALLIVDEAHASGLYGPNGEGLVVAHQLQDRVFACVHTFGKALGLHGAVVTGSVELREYLINHARSFIFTTALPPAIYKQLQEVYHQLPTANRLGLQQKIAFFRNAILQFPELKWMESITAIQGLLLENNHLAKAVASHAQAAGYFVRPILSPTVPAGKERIRICLHLFNEQKDITAFIACLADAVNQFKPGMVNKLTTFN